MAANLILTIGLRDVQLLSPIEGISTYPVRGSGTYCLAEVRDGSQFLLDGLDHFIDNIQLPIAEPALKYALDKHAFIDNFILVSTDQGNEKFVDEHHKKNDTCITAKLIEKWLLKRYRMQIGRIVHKIVHSNVIYYDDMYSLFDENFKNREVFDFDRTDDIILMAQSGIDAINMALLLNCIQYYPQSIQLHKPENTDRASELNFPHKFHRNLKRVRLTNLLENYNYAAIAELEYNKASVLYASYAYSRLIFDYDEAARYLQELSDFDKRNESIYHSDLTNLQLKSEKERQKEIYLSAKILLKQKAYSDFLVRMFSLFEILLKPDIEEYLGGKIIYSEPNHEDWNALIQKNTELVKYLDSRKFGKSKLNYSSPNKHAYKAIRNYFINKNQSGKDDKEKKFDLLFRNLGALSDLRNQSVHYGMKININDIENKLMAIKSSLHKFIELADNHFKIKDTGVYMDINIHMRKLL